MRQFVSVLTAMNFIKKFYFAPPKDQVTLLNMAEALHLEKYHGR